jgi:hypothetical protein
MPPWSLPERLGMVPLSGITPPHSSGARSGAKPEARVAPIMPVFSGQVYFCAAMISLPHSSESTGIIAVDDGSDSPLDTRGFDLHSVRFQRSRAIIAALDAGLIYAIERGYPYISRVGAVDFADASRPGSQAAYLEQVCLYSYKFEAAEDYELFLRIGGKYPIAVVPCRLVSVVSGAAAFQPVRGEFSYGAAMYSVKLFHLDLQPVIYRSIQDSRRSAAADPRRGTVNRGTWD